MKKHLDTFSTDVLEKHVTAANNGGKVNRGVSLAILTPSSGIQGKQDEKLIYDQIVQASSNSSLLIIITIRI